MTELSVTRVRAFIEAHRLVDRQRPLLVAVSGGPDSVCLLHVLTRLQDELAIKLAAAHLNHGLRGADADADAEYVAALCRRLGIPVTIERRDVKAYRAQHRISLEEAAREVRYTFLAEVARSIGADRVAVGHTTDDHIETILMHLIRGAGTRGLRGLEPGRPWPLPGSGVTIVRPLLTVSRAETASYCQQHQLMPRSDASNRSLSPLRNRVRLKLLPLLRSYNPQITAALLRTAAIATDDLAFIDAAGARQWAEVARPQENAVVLLKEPLLHLPPALQRHLLRAAIEKLLGTLKDIETRHIEELLAALEKPAGKQIVLPFGLVFSIEYDRYLLGRDPDVLSPLPPLESEVALNVPGDTDLPGWQVTATIVESASKMGKPEGAGALSDDFSWFSDRESRGVEPPLAGVWGCPPDTKSPPRLGDLGGSSLNLSAQFDLAKTGAKLTVRSRRRGDRFQPLGMAQPKTVAEFMIDARIPRAWRDGIPIVCSAEQIIWVVGWRIDERVKVSGRSRQTLRLEFRRG